MQSSTLQSFKLKRIVINRFIMQKVRVFQGWAHEIPQVSLQSDQIRVAPEK